MMKRTLPARLTASALAVLMSGCAVGPIHQQPAMDVPVDFKEGRNQWNPPAPSDALQLEPWWQLFGDTQLNELASRVEVSNQNVAAAVAAYAQARALVAEQRASLFPTVTLDNDSNRSGSGGGGRIGKSYKVTIGGSWETDVWGRLQRGVDAARAGEHASSADLAAAQLSAQGELAANYFALRGADVQLGLLDEAIKGYQRSLDITQIRYTTGLTIKTDVLQAQISLANAQADALTLERQRAQLEHAIAVLMGQAPANFTLTAVPSWQASVVPAVPVDVPSMLLQRRPDIAAAERRVAAASERVGIVIAGYYPSLRLTGSAVLSATRAGELFRTSNRLWALGVSLAQTIYGSGATTARVDGANAALDEAAARYRQAVLAAFGQVEDGLVALSALAQQLALRQQAAQAARRGEEQVLNRYKAGQVGYTEVITAQATTLSARRNLAQMQVDQQTATVALIQALGGGWKGI